MEKPVRIVTDSMIGMKLPDYARHSPRVATVLGHNPSPFTGPGTNPTWSARVRARFCSTPVREFRFGAIFWSPRLRSCAAPPNWTE